MREDPHDCAWVFVVLHIGYFNACVVFFFIHSSPHPTSIPSIHSSTRTYIRPATTLSRLDPIHPHSTLRSGADIVDCCFDSMSGLTSQPSMGAIVNGLAGTELDTGIDPAAILPLSNYWEQTRELYSPFESNMKAVSSDVYVHEVRL